MIYIYILLTFVSFYSLYVFTKKGLAYGGVAFVVPVMVSLLLSVSFGYSLIKEISIL